MVTIVRLAEASTYTSTSLGVIDSVETKVGAERN